MPSAEGRPVVSVLIEVSQLGKFLSWYCLLPLLKQYLIWKLLKPILVMY